MSILQQLNQDLSSVIDRVLPSLVRLEEVTPMRRGDPRSISTGAAGSGTIWHGDGLIITNAHVVGGRQMRVVLQDGTELPAQVIAIDEQLDVAALAVTARDLPTIELGDSRALKPGDWVTGLGHPWGIHNSLTSGVVIGTGKDLPEMRGDRDWIALSLHLRPGHSGGPLVDIHGRLVGINTMISGPDVGFAVPVHVIKEVLKDTIGKAVAV